MGQILGWLAFIIWGATLYLLFTAWNTKSKLGLLQYLGISLSAIMIFLAIYVNR